MSYFPDGSPNEVMLQAMRDVQSRFGLTVAETVVLILNAATAIADPYGTQSNEIERTHERVTA